MTSASSTCTQLTVCNLSLTSARCTGFTKHHRDNDFSFVIDLEWTDERCVSVKRSFSEFQNFHQELLKMFPELYRSKLTLRTSLRENVYNLFSKDKRGLAEKRETIIDVYLCNLLRQPERIRRGNTVLSFFDSRDTDPKPCKTNSPSEKSDSGIDLTGDRTPERLNLDSPTNGNSIAGENQVANNRDLDDDNQSGCSSDYEGDTSETETDDEDYNEDYFLDVGYGELMLTSHNSIDEDGPETEVPMSPTTEGGNDSHMWCSNLDKFSNILRSSMTNLSSPTDNGNKSYRTLKSLSSVDHMATSDLIIDDLIEESRELVEETSETESQLTTEDRPAVSGDHESSEEEEQYYSKPLSKTNMKHYYLSADDLLNI